MKVILIAALSKQTYAIGRKGKLPWHIPLDLKRFNAVTKGHVVVMGRKTYDSLGKPLPNRENWVVTRQKDYRVAEGVTVVGSLNEAFERLKSRGLETLYVLGGGEIYTQALPRADELDVTIVDLPITDGDAFFPKWNAAEFTEVWREDHFENQPPFSFLRLARRN